MYIILTITLAAISLLALWIANWDYLHPAFINSIVYLASAVGCLAALNSWIIQPLDPRAFMMVVGGTMLFAIGALVVYRKNGDERYDIQQLVLWYDKIDTRAFLLVVGLLILCCIVSKAEMISVGTAGHGLDNGESLSDIQQQAKWAANKDVMIEGKLWISKITFPLNQCFIVLVPVMLALQILKHNGFFRMKLILLIVAFALIGTNALISGERISVLLAISAFAIVLILFARRSGVRDSLIVKRIFCWVVPAFLLVAVLGYAALPLTGRDTEANIVDYISFYLGGGIPALSEYFDSGMCFEPEVTGGATFKNLITFLGRYFSDMVQLEDATGNIWIDFGGGLKTNIFTRYFRYYLDFGWGGFAVITVMCGAFYGYLYKIISRTQSLWMCGLVLFFVSYLVDAARQEAFCTLMAPFLLKFMLVLFMLIKALTVVSTRDKSND